MGEIARLVEEVSQKNENGGFPPFRGL
jgi:hypothetical protein